MVFVYDEALENCVKYFPMNATYLSRDGKIDIDFFGLFYGVFVDLA